MAFQLTARKERALQSLAGGAETGQPPPTLREICAHFGWASSATARDHLRALVRKGALAKEPRCARGHRPTAGAPRSRAVPVLGQISAGRPLLAEENKSGEVAVPLAWAKGAFALRVMGDSMVGAGILEGDLVIARSGREA